MLITACVAGLLALVTGLMPLSAAACQREWDALDCQRRGGVFDAHRCICEFPQDRSSHRPSSGPVVIQNHCRKPIRLAVGVASSSDGNLRVLGWWTIDPRPAAKNFGELLFQELGHALAPEPLIYKGELVRHYDDYYIYVHAMTWPNHEYRWRGDRYFAIDGSEEKLSFQRISVYMDKAGYVQVPLSCP